MPSGPDRDPVAGPADASTVVFALATDSDVTDVANLVQLAYRGDASRQGWTTEAGFLEGQRVDEDMVREILDEPDAMILVARIDGRLVGCCELRSHDRADDLDDTLDAGDSLDAVRGVVDHLGSDRRPVAAYLGMFAVDPAIQASGLGRIILAEAESRVRRRWDAQSLVITVISLRTELISWYERRGFRLTGATAPFPYEDQRFGVPLRDDLEFVELEKRL